MAQKKLCIWLNQKGGPCPWQSLPNMDYCKRHSIYQGVFTKEDIPHLKKCSGCKNMFKNEENNSYKMCVKCRQRSVLNNEKIKKENEGNKCQGINQNNTPCPYKALKNDTYCKNHQTYKRWKETIDSGKNMCNNWIRGCFEIIDLTAKQCAACRKKAQEKENKLNQTKRATALDYNKNPTSGEKMCVKCNTLTTTLKNNQCLKCYDTYQKCENNRNTRTFKGIIIKKLSEYKLCAKNRNIAWNLENEYALELFNSKCTYCNLLVTYNGIDRLDSNGPYSEDNCVACCKECNYMKGTHAPQTFLNIVEYILAVNNNIEIEPKIEHAILFQCSHTSSYSRFINDAQYRNISCTITKDYYTQIISNPCAYCKNHQQTGSQGIDRIDSSMGYFDDNITACCKTCNYMKNSMSVYNFFHHLQNIYNYSVLNKLNEQLSIPNQIKQLCLNVKTMKHEKFFHKKEFYDNLTFGFNPDENTLNAVKNIQPELEFVNNKNQQDIWNYFRRNVSSLNKLNNARLIGRQIHILAKDKKSGKYLGIISLSSDVYNLEGRDNYISWTYEDKETKLKHIMNISTCVALQPFGYNFNGGKLMSALAFSLEIMIYYKEKYSDNLLGLTTTSLYGKSIQYDRLPFLKILGYTKGHSVKDIPSEVTRICADYLKKECGYNYPLRKKFIILQKAFDKLGISKEDFLQSNKKGIYFGYTAHNSRDILLGKTPAHMCPQYNEYVKPTAEVFDWWVHRWAIQRFTNLVKKNKVQTSVSVSV